MEGADGADELAVCASVVGRSLLEYSNPGTELSFVSKMANTISKSFSFRETFEIFSSQHSEKLFRNLTELITKLFIRNRVS